MRALATAEEQGLDPAAFAVPETTDPAERELLLTDAFLRYAAALAQGRVPQGEVDSDWTIAAPSFDPGKALDRARFGDVTAVLASLLPDNPAYERLRQALPRYRGYAKAGAWHTLAVTLPMKRGDSGDDVGRLRERLAAEGFAPGDGDDFDETLEAAVKRFQATRGLAEDGAVGPGTLAALNVTPAAEVKAIRLNLERWRSLPRGWPARRIEVNVPGETMTLFQPEQPVLTMRAIVGAPQHQTPVLRARMVSVLLNPPWNVPSSIIENEIRPALKRDPKYLERNDYAYVEVNGGHQLQQLPGPKNALGKVKFEMPNLYDIYLHDTPSHLAFQRASRSLSHGCIRLENPRALAHILLTGEPEWDGPALDAAITTGATQRIALPHSLPVYILYVTAFVDEDGTVEFRNDIYGRDRRLAEALAAQAAGKSLGPITQNTTSPTTSPGPSASPLPSKGLSAAAQ